MQLNILTAPMLRGRFGVPGTTSSCDAECAGTSFLLFSQPSGSHMLMLAQQEHSMLIAEPSVMPALPQTVLNQPGAAQLRPEELLVKDTPRVIISIHWLSEV